MSLKEFRKLIRKFIEEELNEASVTGNIDGGAGPPQTPYAFRKKKDEEEESGFQDGHINPETGTTYKKVKSHEHNVYGVKTKKYKPLGEGKLTEATKKWAVKVSDIGVVIVDASSAGEAKQLVGKKLKGGIKDIVSITKALPGKKVGDVGEGKITEGRYHDFRNDDTKTPKQKIGIAMRETRDSLTELERIVKMNVKLKNELNVDSRSYWKNTHKALSKISERLVKLANKVGQLQ